MPDNLHAPLQWLVEPRLKVLDAVEDLWQQKVQQRPQLRQVVLERCSRQQQPVAACVLLAQDERELAVRVLHAVALVDDDVLPLELAQLVLVAHDVGVGGQHDVELAAGEGELEGERV